MRNHIVDVHMAHDSIRLVVTLFVLLVFLVQNVAGSTYMSLLMQSYATVTSPPVILQNGTAGEGTIYTNSTSAKVSAVAPAPVPTYYPNGYSILTGNYVSGSVPTSVETADSDYFIVASSGSATSTLTYNPSGHTLGGSTTLVSGGVSNLTSDDSVYMVFKSYYTGTETSYNPSGYNLLGSTTLASGSTTDLASNDSVYMAFESYFSDFSSVTNTRAFVGYRSNTGANALSSPKGRTWNGTAWSTESEMADAGSPIRFVRVAYSPMALRYYERIAVTLSDDGSLDAYVWNGTAWSVTNNIASVGTTANAYRPFDIEYEKTSGRALLVYYTDTTEEIGYKIWNGTSWSTQYTYDVLSGSKAKETRWISLAQNPKASSNEIALVCLVIDPPHDLPVYALIWNGSAWIDQHELTTDAKTSNYEEVAVAYEQSSGYANFAYTEGSNAHVVRRTGVATYADYTVIDLSGGNSPILLSLKADPASNRLMLLGVSVDSELYTADWNSTTWTSYSIHDEAVDSDTTRCADVEWEPSGSKVLMVWGNSSGSVAYKTWTPAGGWTANSTISMVGTHPWVQLRRDPRGVGPKILGATLDSNYDLGSLSWNGTTITGTTAAFTSDTTVTTYECFEIDFQRFGDPIYTSEVEFTGASNTNTWSQLVWTVDSAWNTSSVNVTLQLYNWNISDYPSSGDGYVNYASSATADTDETQDQTITTNPQYYRNATGNWKIKVKGVKKTNTTFQSKADWIEFKPTTPEYTSEVEFTGSSNTYTWTQLNVTVDSSWTMDSVGVTIQIYNSTAGQYPTAGEGYLAYTSGTANTDETKILTITTNPQHFRNATGNWKIKIKGTKNTGTQFDFKADWVEYKPTHYSEYTVSTEFIFSVMTENTPTQLNFTVVTQHNTTGVNVTIQVWNYSSSAYVTSGEGYSTYTSSGSNETTDLSINTNPQFYTSGGNSKIKVTGVLTTNSTYQQETNQIKLAYKYDASSTYDYVLAVTEQDAVDWKVNLTVYASSNIARLSGTTISFYDGTSSDQIIISGGSIMQSEGPTYNLNSSSTIKIKMSDVDATSSGISHLHVYLKILVPDTSTYALYIIAFEIT